LIGVDTNVLVRYLTQDDPFQARRVDAFLTEAMDREARLFIDDIVLCETVWVLSAAYRMGKSTIVAALEDILSTSMFSFEDRELLNNTLNDYREGSADFADYMIGRRNTRSGCEQTVTFDRSLNGRDGFELL
jgi:predicted nucleic-acid-binding protein